MSTPSKAEQEKAVYDALHHKAIFYRDQRDTWRDRALTAEPALEREIERATENGRLAQQHYDRAQKAEAELLRYQVGYDKLLDLNEKAEEVVEAAMATLVSLGDHPVIGHRLRDALTAYEEQT